MLNKRRFQQYHPQQGIGLLEVILAMVIVAVITLLAGQYFGASRRSTTVSRAVDEIRAMIETVKGMPNPPTSATQLSSAIALSGQIPTAYVYQSRSGVYFVATPWAKSTYDNKSSFLAEIVEKPNHNLETQYALVISSGVNGEVGSTGANGSIPNWSCQALAKQFQHIAGYVSCSDSNGNAGGLRLEFPWYVGEF